MILIYSNDGLGDIQRSIHNTNHVTLKLPAMTDIEVIVCDIDTYFYT